MPVNYALDPASTLCTSCGLCCDGYLHSYAVLREAELEPATALGLPVLTDGRCGFSLPCPKLVDRCCSIYERRPQVCSGYKCRLLNNLNAGKVSLDVALATVSTARAMAAAFETDRAAPPEPGSIVASQHTLRRTAFRLYIDKFFLNLHEDHWIKQPSDIPANEDPR